MAPFNLAMNSDYQKIGTGTILKDRRDHVP